MPSIILHVVLLLFSFSYSIATNSASIPESQLYARAASSDDATMSVLVADKLTSFFQSRSLRWNIIDKAADLSMTTDDGNINVGFTFKPKEFFEGRGKNKQLIPALVAGVATKVGILGALALKALVLLVGKALLVSKIALFLSVIIGIKKLFEKKQTTYEVVAQPQGGHGGWGRSFTPESFLDVITQITGEPFNAQEMAYSAYQQ